MARVTVEDCIDKVENRFELVMLASQRARRIGSGAEITVERDNDKNPVIALREVADETVQVADLKEELIQSRQKIIENDDEDDSVIDLMDGEEEWAKMATQDTGAVEGEGAPQETAQITKDDTATPSLEELAGMSGE